MHDLSALRWDDLRVFLAVMRAGSFTQAAGSLGADQSTVTRRVRALELALGQTLFERRHDGLVAQPVSHTLATYAERMESDLLGFVSAAANTSQEPEGRVRLATTESFAAHVLIPHVLADFRAAYPRIALELVLSDVSADLTRHEADLALRFFRPAHGDLVAKRLLSLPTAVLGQRAYVRKKQRARAALDWVVHALPGSASADVALLAGAKPAYTMSSHLAQVEAVRAGLGVAVLTRALTFLDPNLVEVSLLLPSLPPVELWLVAGRGARALPRVHALWRYLEARLPALLEARQTRAKKRVMAAHKRAFRAGTRRAEARS